MELSRAETFYHYYCVQLCFGLGSVRLWRLQCQIDKIIGINDVIAQSKWRTIMLFWNYEKNGLIKEIAKIFVSKLSPNLNECLHIHVRLRHKNYWYLVSVTALVKVRMTRWGQMHSDHFIREIVINVFNSLFCSFISCSMLFVEIKIARNFSTKV